MDDLRPDKDEVDRFRSQRFGAAPQVGDLKGGTAAEPNSAPSKRENEADTSKPGGQLAEIESVMLGVSQNSESGSNDALIAESPSGRAAKAHAKGKNVSEKRPGAGGSIRLLFLCFLVVSGYLGWQVWEQKQSLGRLEESLHEATKNLKQSELQVARLDGRVTESNSELQASGNQFEEKVAFLESEVKKLWGIANDRNKKAIEENRSGLQTVVQSAKALEERLNKALEEVGSIEAKVKSGAALQSEMAARVTGLVQNLDTQAKGLSALEKEAKGLREQLAKRDESLAVMRAELVSLKALAGNLDQMSEQLGVLRSGVKQVETKVSANNQAKATLAEKESAELGSRMQSLETAIESIDSFRQATNDRTIRLERRVNELQLQIQAQTPTLPSK